MCGRYKVSTPGDELWETFDVHGEQLPLVPRFNIAPTQAVPIVRTPHVGELLRWGIASPGAKSGGFNVRVESLAAPQYREAIRERRCLVLADGFYEWKALVEAKKPYLIQRRDHKPFAFAGFWKPTTLRSGETVDAITILTTTPHGVMSRVHERMPVILPQEACARWLDPASRYRDLLEPDASALELVAVSTLVNSVKNDDARLVEPLSSAE